MERIAAHTVGEIAADVVPGLHVNEDRVIISDRVRLEPRARGHHRPDGAVYPGRVDDQPGTHLDLTALAPGREAFQHPAFEHGPGDGGLLEQARARAGGI